jgi:putative tryptophan/tyrosine transport system substrate-binding protein
MAIHIRRREFIATLAGGAVAWPIRTRAQQLRQTRIGILHPGSPPDPWLEGLRQGLRDLGYTEGHNIVLEYRWAEGKGERLDRLAQELIENKVDIFVIMTGPAVLAARRRTTTVPIVMAISGDPVGIGVVANLARPGGNVTGFSLMSGDLAGLRLGVLKEAVPAAKRVAALYNPTEPPTAQEMRDTEAAARTLGIAVQPLEARSGDDLEQAFSRAAAERADALITFAHGFAFVHRRRIADLAAQHRLPAMYGWREYAEVGGLMTYGPNVTATLRRAASYVDRIIKGANPADLPVEQPTKFELVINLKTAKALGLEMPPTLIVRADEVIE